MSYFVSLLRGMGGKADLRAPAAVLGPNHSPTSFPSSLPINAMRWTLNGHRGDGSSKNQDRMRIWVAKSSNCSGSSGLATGIRHSTCQPSFASLLNRDSPLPRCRCIRAFASILCPVLNIHPQPASLVNPRSSPFLAHPQAELEGRLGKEVEPIEVE